MQAEHPGAGGAVVITGATDGVGRGLALRLAAEGADLILHGRSAEKGRELLAELRAAGAGRLAYELADFASLAEVDALADRLLGYERIGVLVNNAGIGVELARQESRDGHELTFQVDYLATYVLSCRLAAKLAADAPARIVNVTSAGQAPIDFDDVMLRRYWDGGQAYCQAKLAQIMLTVDLAEALRGTGVSVNCLHPASYMPTKIVTHLFVPRSELSEGVENVRRLARDPLPPGGTGLYLNRATVAEPQAQAQDPAARARLRELSAQLTGVKFPDLDAARGEQGAGQGA